MTPRARGRVLFVVAAAFALLAASARTAEAFCGFYVSGAGKPLFNRATQVVLLRDGTRTVLSMQNDYQGPPESFALVVPVPVVLQKENVHTLPRALFDRIDDLTAPRLVEYWEQDPCAEDEEMNTAGGTGTRAKGEEGSMGRPGGRGRRRRSAASTSAAPARSCSTTRRRSC